MQRRRAMNADVLPTFVEPNRSLPSSPHNRAFGVRLGQTLFAEIKGLTDRLGLQCKDTSIRALMKRRREAMIAKAQADSKKANGKKVDGKSGASKRSRSPRERNPSIRWSCEKIPHLLLPDRKRGGNVKGRLLFVFDSPKHPLRNVSFQYDSLHLAGVKEIQDMRSFYLGKFGQPHQAEGVVPKITPGMDAKIPWLRKYEVIRYQWKFADLEVLLQLRSYGSWVNLLEQVSVPWPVRPDAPVLRTRVTGRTP